MQEKMANCVRRW